MPRSERRNRRPPGPRMGVSVRDVDFREAESVTDRLKRVAEVAPHGEINMMQTAELLIDGGLTRSKSRFNVVTTIHRAVKRSPDFVWLRRGWWQYVRPKTTKVVDDTTAAEDTELASAPVEPDASEVVGETDLASVPAEPYVPPRTMQWLDGKVEYRGANTLRDKLLVMAQHTVDRTLEPRETSRRLLHDGQSTARQRNLERVVRRMLRDDPEFAELALPTDWYQYRPRRERPSGPSVEASPSKRFDMRGTPWESISHEETIYVHNGHTENLAG